MGAGTNIPAFMIGKQDGHIFKEAIIMSVNFDGDQTNQNQKQSGHQVILQAVVGGKIDDRDSVRMDLWYSSVYELF